MQGRRKIRLPLIQCAKPIGVNSTFIFSGNTLINLPSIFLYQILCKFVIFTNLIVENPYCSTSFPVSLGFGHGVGSDNVQIGANTTYFKYLT